MCKLSLNTVPNVYNSLQGSFLSFAWPWPGRSLPKGTQWEFWDPGLGTNVVGLPVHLTPPDAPYKPPIPLLAPEHLHSLPAPNAPLTAPTTPDGPNIPWWPQHPLGVPNAPIYLCRLLSTYTLCQSPMHPWRPPMLPQWPSTPMPLYPAGPWAPTLPASPQCTPDTANTLDSPHTP